MDQNHPNKPGFLQTLAGRLRSGGQESPDLLLQTAVSNSLAQLAASGREAGGIAADSLGKMPLTAAQNAFGFALFRVLANGNKRNLFVSPTSIVLCLSMVYNGADGETQTEMARTLCLDSLSLDAINEQSAALLDALNADDAGVVLRVANSLWMPEADRLTPAFRGRSQKYFQAELRDLKGAPDTINAWVREKTNGRITHIVGPDDLEGDLGSLLLNAIYFYGAWAMPFSLGQTYKKAFMRIGGGSSPCDMMYQSGEYDYYGEKAFQAIRLPYIGEQVSMLVFLPSTQGTLSQFLATMTPESFAAWRAQFTRREGSISLPRFRCEYEINLNIALEIMGMGVAFQSPGADFSQMAPRFYIGQARHKAFLDVKEEGVEAAAITEMAQFGGKREPKAEKRFNMMVDRPFFCAIVDERTDALLFMGAIVAP